MELALFGHKTFRKRGQNLHEIAQGFPDYRTYHEGIPHAFNFDLLRRLDNGQFLEYALPVSYHS